MPTLPTCPRCDAALRPPSLRSSDWRCPDHGVVAPLHQPLLAPPATARSLGATVPVWLPWPMPDGWLLTGFRAAGDQRTGVRAVAVACSGRGMLAGADVLLVAEEPGVGLGGRYAGCGAVDPGDGVVAGTPETRVVASRHEAPLWSVPTPGDRAAFVGEAAGCWLWVVVWPVDELLVVQPSLRLVDLRDPGPAHEAPLGALNPRLRG